MTATVLPWVLSACTLSLLLAFFRLLRGPALPDRILALDTLYVNALLLLLVGGIQFGTTLYFEGALIIAMLGFVGTIALCKYLLRGRIIQ
jgi:multicomponent K+:H+ antiporter subunit F